ncbi:MAG: FAD-dependent oxidoreductase [bacterium]
MVCKNSRRQHLFSSICKHHKSFFSGIIGILFFSGCFNLGLKQEESLDISNIKFDEYTVPVVILGGGIAGLTAAVYFSQAGIPCMVIEGPTPGGALSLANSVRNWPGVIDAPGKKISEDLQKQVMAGGGGVSIMKEQVIAVDLEQWPRLIEVQNLQDLSLKKSIRALSVIVAMGKEPKILGVPGEKGPDGYWGKGVGNCGVCEGSLYKNKTVAVVGGGDAAIIEAKYLIDIAKKVYLLVRKDEFRTKKVLELNALLANPKIEALFNTDVKSIWGDKTYVTHIVISNNKTGESREIPIDGLLLGIGSNPNSTMLKQLALDDMGFVLLKKGQETLMKGVYAAGVIVASDQEGGQAINAASDGCKAALQAIKFLKELGFSSTAVVGH